MRVRILVVCTVSLLALFSGCSDNGNIDSSSQANGQTACPIRNGMIIFVGEPSNLPVGLSFGGNFAKSDGSIELNGTAFIVDDIRADWAAGRLLERRTAEKWTVVGNYALYMPEIQYFVYYTVEEPSGEVGKITEFGQERKANEEFGNLKSEWTWADGVCETRGPWHRFKFPYVEKSPPHGKRLLSETQNDEWFSTKNGETYWKTVWRRVDSLPVRKIVKK